MQMTEFDADIPDELLPALDAVPWDISRPPRHAPPDLLAKFPAAMVVDETLVWASIWWPKSVGRPTAKHLYQGFDIQMYRKDKVYGFENAAERDWDINTPMARMSVRDSNVDNDSHYGVHIVAHMHSTGNKDSKGRDMLYTAEVALLPGIKWTSPAALFTQGRYRTVDPPKRWFSFPGPVRLDPFTVQFVVPEFHFRA